MKTILNNVKILRVIIFFSSLAFAAGSCEVADDIVGNEDVAALEGEWSVDETSEVFDKSTLSVYAVTVSADPDNLNGVIIDNFYNVGISIKATVSGNSLIIPNQNAEDGYTVYGSGTISGNSSEINMSYTVNDGSAQDDNCTAVFTKI
ncbi:MAG TPA: hypothetical protein VHI78_10780 [Bacteroidales bacterium]|jgi:hypothetical protein|nr:hypothetical protein [Bacteroidales bacterium]